MLGGLKMKEVRLNITKIIQYECCGEMSEEDIALMGRMNKAEFHQFLLEKMEGPGVRTDTDSHDAEYEIL